MLAQYQPFSVSGSGTSTGRGIGTGTGTGTGTDCPHFRYRMAPHPISYTGGPSKNKH